MTAPPNTSADEPVNPAKKRGRLGLSLRAMMALIVIVSMFLAWHINRARATRRAIGAVEAAGGAVVFNEFDYDRPEAGRRLAWLPVWVIDRVGVEYFYDVIEVYAEDDKTWDDDASRVLLEFPSLESFSLPENDRFTTEPRVTDATMAVLACLPRLRKLQLVGDRITDSGIRRLRSCTALESVSIRNRELSGSGLAELAALPNLRELDLPFCSLDDEGVNALGRLTRLERLEFRHELEDCQHCCRLSGSWPRIRELVINRAEMHHSDWESLGRLSEIEQLELRGTNVSDADLVAFRALTKLRSLTLRDSDASTEGVGALQKCLPTLTIHGNAAEPLPSQP